MATSKAQWDHAYDLLSQFERELIDPKLFKWEFFTENVGASKQTFMRNEEFNSAFKRVRGLVKKYKNSEAHYSLEASKKSQKDQEIETLKLKVQKLEAERDRAREQLAYACMIARQKNIDPDLFMEESPLILARAEKKSKPSLETNSVVAQLRQRKK
jgi:hypothetical protein